MTRTFLCYKLEFICLICFLISLHIYINFGGKNMSKLKELFTPKDLTEGTPWIDIYGGYKECNVEAELEDKDSILNFYKQLIKLRKENKALIYGDIRILDKKRRNSFVYLRRIKGSMFLIECNLSQNSILKKKKRTPCELIMSNYLSESEKLRPYESNLYRVIEDND